MKTIQEINPRISILYLISFQGENILENFNNTFQVKESLTESYYLYTYDSEELLIKDLLFTTIPIKPSRRKRRSILRLQS